MKIGINTLSTESFLKVNRSSENGWKDWVSRKGKTIRMQDLTQNQLRLVTLK